MDTATNVLSILFNVYLLFLIRYYSTFGVKLYKYLLSIDVILDLCLSVATLLAQPVAVTGDGYFVYMSNGFFCDRSSQLDSIMLMLFCFLLHTNILWIPVQFVYRYRLLCKENAKSIAPNILIFLTAIAYNAILLVVIVKFFQVRPESQHIAQYVLDLNGWPKEAAMRKFLVVYYITDWQTLLWISLWTCTSLISIFIVYWCEKSIITHFKQIGNPSNSKTQRMHKEFHRALLAMAICPLITTAFPVFYFCTTIALQLCPGRISIVMMIVLTSITIFNPLTTIICFRCYRKVTARWFLCGRISISIKPATSQSTVTGQSTSGAVVRATATVTQQTSN